MTGRKGNVLVLGVIWQDLYEVSARQANVTLTFKHFQSKPENWRSIVNIVNSLDSTEADRVALRLSPDTILRACSDHYSAYFEAILAAIVDKHHIIMCHQDLLSGDPMWLSDRNSLDAAKRPLFELRASKYGIEEPIQLTMQRFESLVNSLRSSEYAILPYYHTEQVTNFTNDFIEGSLMDRESIRFFVPQNILGKHELERFVDLVRDYCSGLGLSDISISRNDTALGTHFKFKIALGVSSGLVRLEDIFGQFNLLLNECIRNPIAAAEALSRAGISKERADALCTRLAREGARLQLDVEYYFRSKVLEIEHEARRIIIGGPDESLQFPGGTSLTQITIGTLNLVGSSFISNSGDDPQSRVISDFKSLISDRATGVELAALNADIVALEDEEIPGGERLSAYARLKRFVARHADKIEDIAVKTFIAWLESRIAPK